MAFLYSYERGKGISVEISLEMAKTAFIISLVVLGMSPLFFATVHTFAYTSIFLAILVAGLLLLKSNIITEHTPLAHLEIGGKARLFNKIGSYQFRVPKTPMNPLYFIFLIFLVIQLIPLPDFLLVKLSPEAKITGDLSLPAVGTLVPSGFRGQWHSLAPYIYPVRMSLIRWVVYGLLFLILFQTMNSRKRIEAVIILVLITGCFDAIYGIMQTYSGNNHIWWFKSLSGPRDVSGTYINRNHFAGFMEMGIILAVAYAGALSDKSKKVSSGCKNTFNAKLLKYLSGEQIFTRKFLIIFSGILMSLGLLLSASRSGIISTAGALLLMGLFFSFRRDQRRKGIIILLLFFLTSVYALHIGIDHTLGRFQLIDKDFEYRARYTRKTMDLFADYRVTGVGIGNFQYAYPKYQAPEDKRDFIEYAHNDWAQFLAETGVVGLLLLVTAMGYYLFMTILLWLERRSSFAVCLGVAPIAALFAMAIHSFFDFNLHIPANFIILTAIVAIGTSALHVQRHNRKTSGLAYNVLPFRRGGLPVLLLSIALIFWSVIWTIRHCIAEAYCHTAITSPLNLSQHPPVEKIYTAIAWDGGNAEYYNKLAIALMKIREQRTSVDGEANEKHSQTNKPIINALEKAIFLNPFNVEYHIRLGWEYSYLWKQPDYMGKWLPAADVCMERAAYLAGNWAINPHIHVDIGNYWTMRSGTFKPGGHKSEEAWTKALWQYHKAQELDDNKGIRKEITQYIKNFYKTPEDYVPYAN